MRNIVIIGGGLSSRLLIIQLLLSAGDMPFVLTIIEKESPERLGDAFCTEKDYHLLNVPVSKISGIPEKPDDLLIWLREEGYDYGPDSFIPRKIYKNYISSILEREIRNCGEKIKLSFISGEACDIDAEQGKVVLSSGVMIRADKVILAIGNFPPADLIFANGADHYPGYYRSAWQSDMFYGLDPAEPVLIIGTGLTMVDVVLMLKERCHEGDVLALSHHGFIPVAHKQASPYPPFYHELEDLGTAASIFGVVKEHIRRARDMGIDWRAVIDSLRPFTQKIWGNLPAAEKLTFMEHLRHLWGVGRHRMAPENASVIHSLVQTGRLKIIAGRIRTIKGIAPHKFLFEFTGRGSEKVQCRTVAAIVNCMGPASNYNRITQPLLKNLLKKQLIRTDDLRLGIDCFPDGSVIENGHRRSDFLFTIGPPMKGVLWESTAIPEIRSQARQMALALTSRLRSDVPYSPELL